MSLSGSRAGSAGGSPSAALLSSIEQNVRDLTGRHEVGRPQSWSVDDAPPQFIEGLLRAIVGVELLITRIEAKFKLSQNRPAADVDGMISGLITNGHEDAAQAVRRARTA